jgi:hypothetical protein
MTAWVISSRGAAINEVLNAPRPSAIRKSEEKSPGPKTDNRVGEAIRTQSQIATSEPPSPEK